VRPASEVALLQAEVAEHRLGDGDVFGLTAVGSGCERELVVTPSDLVEAAGCDEWHHLKRLRARSPHGDRARLACLADHRVVGIDDGRVDAMA
jgi:hypothetical protein